MLTNQATTIAKEKVIDTSSVFTYYHSDNEITRYQIIKIKKPGTISSLKMRYNPQVLSDLSRLSLIHLIPKKPEIGSLGLFLFPEDLSHSLPKIFTNKKIIDPAAAVRNVLNRSVEDNSMRIENGIVVSSIREINTLLKVLYKRNLLSLIEESNQGRLLFVPVSDRLGYLSNHFKKDKIVFNSHFFLMDLTDMETSFDVMGEPYGLLMIKGKVISPPLYPRSALFIDKNGNSSIKVISIRDIGIKIGNNVYSHGENCEIMIRPEHNLSPLQKGIDIAVVGSRVVGFSEGGGLEIPTAGYVLHLPRKQIPGSLKVDYVPLNGYFAIQVGPPLIDNGIVLNDFRQPFFTGSGIKYPPTVYPPGWKNGRAARLGIGTDLEGTPIVIWAEGSKPATYRPGVDSKGPSLSEFAEIGKKHGLVNFINLDGGGSSQAAVCGERSLTIADKRNQEGEEFERPIPMGLSVDF